jgi:hypothetical protein
MTPLRTIRDRYSYFTCKTIFALAIFVTANFLFFPGLSASKSIDGLPTVWKVMLNAEQLANDRIENRRVFNVLNQNEIDPSQMPENQPVLPIEKILIPLDQVEVIDTLGGAGTKQIMVTINGKSYVEFFVHPDSRELYLDEISTSPLVEFYEGTPLSSIRSMFIWKAGIAAHPSYIKLTLNRWLGSALRILTKGQIERAVAISYLLKSMNLKRYSGEGIHFIDEPLHVYLKRNKTGYTVRNFPSLKKGDELIPMFALYSRKNRGTSLLVEIIKAGGHDPREFVKKSIIQPMIRHHLLLGLEEGLVGDSHEQNVMVLLHKGKWTGQFYYRDLAGFDVNPELRTQAGSDMSFLPEGFDRKNLKPDRADVIEKALDYILNSNFYALHESLKREFGISWSWIKNETMQTLKEEVFRETGVRATTKYQLKRAIESRQTRLRCGVLLNGTPAGS